MRPAAEHDPSSCARHPCPGPTEGDVNGVSYNSPTCNGSSFAGVGHSVAEAVWYRTLTTKLTSSSGYAAAREGAIASAKELYGRGSADCTAVANAFSAIAVKPGTQTCTN